MDRHRRRFVPSSEGLEGRQLLSTASAPAPEAPAPAASFSTVTPEATTSASTIVQADKTPGGQTIAAKLQRIQGLPLFLAKLNSSGEVPQPTLQNIQNDLTQLVGQLQPADKSAVSTFNLDLRKTQPFKTIRPQDAKALNREFGSVLTSAGANPTVVADLQNQMTDLTNYATTQRNSKIVATNDYAIVLQLALNTGKPLTSPTAAPSLISADHKGNAGKIQLTNNRQPTLTGTYIPGTNVQIVDASGQTVLGTGTVDTKTNNYQVKFDGELPDGTYRVRVRGEESGFVSAPSRVLTFEVRTPPTKSK
ncbi:Ig-like domain-containing protein [Tundrisphaera lichenicola]|uniref:Ig-like domain-containing protein n=1 Tax=Tundrisphaera lichenicola TaxID=2029860 RepID=UPI003EB7D110